MNPHSPLSERDFESNLRFENPGNFAVGLREFFCDLGWRWTACDRRGLVVGHTLGTPVEMALAVGDTVIFSHLGAAFSGTRSTIHSAFL